MEFKVLSADECEQVRIWRNSCLESLRTPYLLTNEQQFDFFKNVICNREAKARYWGIWKTVNMVVAQYRPDGVVHNARDEDVYSLIGMAGIENIEWENRRGEISLIIDPQYRSMGNGDDAFKILLDKAFNELNLLNIWGVCYECNPAVSFWERQINKYNAFNAMLQNMKYFNGQYWRGLYFSYERGNQ
jgi:RimJ/RimL family protein N-acetyltransferase